MNLSKVMILCCDLTPLSLCGQIQYFSFIYMSSIHHYSGFSHFSSYYFVAVFPQCIISGIDYSFTSTSFSLNTRDSMPCFLGISLAHIVAASFQSFTSCYTLLCIIPMTLHTSYILIFLKHLYPKCFLPRHIMNALLKNPHINLMLILTFLTHSQNILGTQTLPRLQV